MMFSTGTWWLGLHQWLSHVRRLARTLHWFVCNRHDASAAFMRELDGFVLSQRLNTAVARRTISKYKQ